MAIKISNVSVIDDNRRELNTRLTTSVITSNTTATAGSYFYFSNVRITLTLPSSPTAGDQVGIAEIQGDTTSSIDRNSSNIMGLSENLIIDKAFASFRLVFVDDAKGWAFT